MRTTRFSGRSARRNALQGVTLRAGTARAGDRRLGERGLLEALEQRVHLALVLWDGGPDGLGTNFNDPVNWENDTPP